MRVSGPCWRATTLSFSRCRLSLICSEWSREFIWGCVRKIDLYIEGPRWNVSAGQIASMVKGRKFLSRVRSFTLRIRDTPSTPAEAQPYHLVSILDPLLETLIQHTTRFDVDLNGAGPYLPFLLRNVNPKIEVLKINGIRGIDLGVALGSLPMLKELSLVDSSTTTESWRRGELCSWISKVTSGLEVLNLRVDTANISLDWGCAGLRKVAEANPSLISVNIQCCRTFAHRRDAFTAIFDRKGREPAQWDNLEKLCREKTGLSMRHLRFNSKTVWDICIREAPLEQVFIYPNANARLLGTCLGNHSLLMTYKLEGLCQVATRWGSGSAALLQWAQAEIESLKTQNK